MPFLFPYPISHEKLRADFVFDQAQMEGPPITLSNWSESKVGETMFEEGLKRPLPEGEENEKDNLQRK